MGYGKTLKRIKIIVEKVAVEKELLKNDRITNDWFASFMSRHPELSLQKGDCTPQTHMSTMDNRHATEQYFAVLRECLENNGLMDKLSQIYNFDEVSVPLDRRPPCVKRVTGQRVLTSTEGLALLKEKSSKICRK